MTASGESPHLRSAIESVLAQRDSAEIDVLVIDRGLTKRSAEALASFRGLGVRQERVPENASTAHCHNFAVENSRAPLIAHMEPSGIVLPGALANIIDRWRAAPHAGLIHGYSFKVNEAGSSTRESFRERRAYLRNTRRPGMDYRWALLFSESEIDPFRVYSRKALEAIGPFREKPASWTEYDLALRIADRFPIEIIPEMLCAFRSGEAPPAPSRMASVKKAIHRFTCCRALQKSGEVSFLRPGGCNLARPLVTSIWSSLKPRGLQTSFERASGRLKSFRGDFFWKSVVPAIDRFYLRFAGRLPWWPIDLFHIRSRGAAEGAKRLAYYTWRFPILSQTFVHRELAALKRSGMELLVLAEEPDDKEMADDNARSLFDQTSYLDQVEKKQIREYKRHFFFRNPFRYLNLIFYLMTRQYRDKKNIMEDGYTFSKAVVLAGVLRDQKAGHVHVPWADQTALIALVASKLAGITYSVQARAHDVHRTSYLYGLRDKLENAEFVVTNTAYNRDYLRQLLGKRNEAKVNLIHNGLDLDRFKPQPAPQARAAMSGFRILCVARLIEQKGLTYLLEACKIIRDQGIDFRCEIIGAPEEPEYTNYYLQLKLLHKKLALGERVVFQGAQPFAEILKKYAEADLFVLPCVIATDGSRDITPNALIEAMAMALCVVSTPVTGVPEIVDDGVNGFLVPPGDAHALAGIMAAALKDPEARRRLGRNARKKVEEKFDVNCNISRYVELFSRIGTIPDPMPYAAATAPDRAVV